MTREVQELPTLVFLHHFGGSARSWDQVIARLGDACETLALDLPGFGDAAQAPGPYTVDAQADFVEARLPSGPFILIGHSMGGKVALALAARRPPALAELLLLAPSPPTPEPIADEARAALIAGWGDHGAMARTLAQITAFPLAGSVRERTVDDMVRAGKAAWNAWLTCGSREDISPAMSRINVPATIMSGADDTVLPTLLLDREVTERLSRVRKVVVQGAGHLLPLEAPDEVASAIVQIQATHVQFA